MSSIYYHEDDQMLSTEFKGNLKDAAYPLWIYWALIRINTSEAENVLKKHNMSEENKQKYQK